MQAATLDKVNSGTPTSFTRLGNGRCVKGSNVNGAESLVRTLVACGVTTCFANPGTSEMHFDEVEWMRAILGLFECAVTGMADD